MATASRIRTDIVFCGDIVRSATYNRLGIVASDGLMDPSPRKFRVIFPEPDGTFTRDWLPETDLTVVTANCDIPHPCELDPPRMYA